VFLRVLLRVGRSEIVRIYHRWEFIYAQITPITGRVVEVGGRTRKAIIHIDSQECWRRGEGEGGIFLLDWRIGDSNI
jgi:hypothetical protein